MTPTEEQAFIERYQAGATYRELAVAFGCALGTVADRAAALVAEGKLAKRPHGGSHGRRRAQGRPEEPPPPVQGSAVQSGAESTAALVPSPAVGSAAIIDLLRQTLARLDTVEQDLKAIREDQQPTARPQPVQSGAVQSGAVQSGAEPPALTPDEARAERWNLWLPRGLRMRIEALAQARGTAPSRIAAELLWAALTDRPPPTTT